MRVIQLPDVLFEYLVHVIEKHSSSGIHPEEGLAVFQLWDNLKNKSTHIDDAALEKMAAAGSPVGQSPADPLGKLQNQKCDLAECPLCWNEERSLSCVRPHHGLNAGRNSGEVPGAV
jgi:hypothetical protein